MGTEARMSLVCHFWAPKLVGCSDATSVVLTTDLWFWEKICGSVVGGPKSVVETMCVSEVNIISDISENFRGSLRSPNSSAGLSVFRLVFPLSWTLSITS